MAGCRAAIAGFSGNVFIGDALKRVNRLRRMVEYRKVVDRQVRTSQVPRYSD